MFVTDDVDEDVARFDLLICADFLYVFLDVEFDGFGSNLVVIDVNF